MYQNILRLEGVMAVLVLCGAALRRSKVITDEGQDCLTDLLTDLILPCNIFLSFPGQTDLETLHSFLITILISVLVMLGTAGLGKVVYRQWEERMGWSTPTPCSSACPWCRACWAARA